MHVSASPLAPVCKREGGGKEGEGKEEGRGKGREGKEEECVSRVTFKATLRVEEYGGRRCGED